MDQQTREKELAGRHAASYVSDGMVVALGTGSTSAWATRAIGERMKNEGLSIQAVCTSFATEKLAREMEIPILDFGKAPSADLYIDGADEIDPHFNMVKGGGGALLREKLIATDSQYRIIIVDSSKRVPILARSFPLPVEIVRFGAEKTIARLRDVIAGEARFRMADGLPFVTDEGHYIADCLPAQGIDEPVHLDRDIQRITGVVTTGFFFGLCDLLVVGRGDSVETFNAVH